MKFKDHAALNMHTNRLQASSQAAAMCEASMKEPQQFFEYAGQRFIGPDAMLIKHALLTALLSLTDEAMDALKRGGIEFEEQPQHYPMVDVRAAVEREVSKLSRKARKKAA